MSWLSFDYGSATHRLHIGCVRLSSVSIYFQKLYGSVVEIHSKQNVGRKRRNSEMEKETEKRKKSLPWWLIKETLSLGVSDFAAVRKVAVYQGDQAGFGVTMMCSWVSWGMERSKVSSSPFYLYCRWVWSSNLWRQHPLGSAGSLWASMAGPGGPAGSLSLVSLVQTVLVLLGASAWYTRNTKAVWTAHFSAQAKPSISSAK